MWFAKWFGGRSDEGDEPARFAPPAPKSVAPAQRMQVRAQGQSQGQSNGGGKPNAANRQVKSGFDPYNSGSFDRNQAWGRVFD